MIYSIQSLIAYNRNSVLCDGIKAPKFVAYFMVLSHVRTNEETYENLNQNTSDSNPESPENVIQWNGRSKHWRIIPGYPFHNDRPIYVFYGNPFQCSKMQILFRGEPLTCAFKMNRRIPLLCGITPDTLVLYCTSSSQSIPLL